MRRSVLVEQLWFIFLFLPFLSRDIDIKFSVLTVTNECLCFAVAELPHHDCSFSIFTASIASRSFVDQVGSLQ